MAASSSTALRKEGKEVINVQLINNEAYAPPNFRAILRVSYKGYLTRALSSILSNALMMNNVRNCYMCKIDEI